MVHTYHPPALKGCFYMMIDKLLVAPLDLPGLKNSVMRDNLVMIPIPSSSSSSFSSSLSNVLQREGMVESVLDKVVDSDDDINLGLKMILSVAGVMPTALSRKDINLWGLQCMKERRNPYKY